MPLSACLRILKGGALFLSPGSLWPPLRLSDFSLLHAGLALCFMCWPAGDQHSQRSMGWAHRSFPRAGDSDISDWEVGAVLDDFWK